MRVEAQTSTVLGQQEALREYRRNRVQDIKKRQEQGASGGQIVASLTGLADEIIERLYRQVMESTAGDLRSGLEGNFAVVALGGYGRGELSPFSDIDLMFLHRGAFERTAASAATGILQTLWDIGYRVGHSVRTINDCIVLGYKDLTIRTSLMESRFLAGNERLFERFRARFERKVTRSRTGHYLSSKLRDRLTEYVQYGTTVYLLEPHVKMSQGGLRDLHLFRWAALTRYHTSSFEILKQHGLLSAREYTALTEAQEFLWRVRNELHFAAGRCQDLLTFEEQIRLSRLWGFRDEPHLLAVEQFMKQYYEQTTTLLDITRPLVEGMIASPLSRRLKRYLMRRTVEGRFRIAGDEISVLPAAEAAVLSRAESLLKLFHLAQTRRLRFSAETQAMIKKAQEAGPLIHKMDREASSIFLRILGRAGSVGGMLRELHRLKLLAEIIPEFSRARGLMQFNQYHKYTVDEHCLRAVEEAEALLDQEVRIGQVYREIQRKDILHLGLLIHDLGKGETRDHTTVGIEIAERMADRLHLDSSERGLLAFLVRHHLLMTRLAFRRDLSDQQVLLQFAKTVATPEALKMLYVLTLSDVAAVGPGTLTVWKKDLIGELFNTTLEILTGEKVVMAEEEKVRKVHESVLAHVDGLEPEWVSEQLAAMTSRYLLSTPWPRIVRHLKRFRELPSDRVLVDAEYDPDRQTTEYTVYTMDDLTPGIFYKIAGALAAKGLQILGANIITLKNKTVVDAFRVQDLDFAGAPTPRKLEKVCRSIQDVLLGRVTVEEMLSQGKRIHSAGRPFPRGIPTQVEVDNGSSEQCTIIEVFAQDRQGLLYIIAKSMFELGLSVHTAKVATQLDQIVDVFYVTDRSGQKVADPSSIGKIKQRLCEAIERFHEAQRSPSPIGSTP